MCDCYILLIRLYNFCSFKTPLHLASHEGYYVCIEMLLIYGAKMDIRNSRLLSPQDLAARRPKCEAVFLHEIAKHRIPDRTDAEKKRVLSKA